MQRKGRSIIIISFNNIIWRSLVDHLKSQMDCVFLLFLFSCNMVELKKVGCFALVLIVGCVQLDPFSILTVILTVSLLLASTWILSSDTHIYCIYICIL